MTSHKEAQALGCLLAVLGLATILALMLLATGCSLPVSPMGQEDQVAPDTTRPCIPAVGKAYVPGPTDDGAFTDFFCNHKP